MDKFIFLYLSNNWIWIGNFLSMALGTVKDWIVLDLEFDPVAMPSYPMELGKKNMLATGYGFQ